MNRTDTAPDMSAPPPTFAAAIRARALDSTDRVFLRFGDATWTFGETHREACRFANLFLLRWLCRVKITPDDD